MAVYGGQTGIRTLETVSRLHAFQACAFDHSATCPLSDLLQDIYPLVQPVNLNPCRELLT